MPSSNNLDKSKYVKHADVLLDKVVSRKKHPGIERENADQYNLDVHIFNELKLNMPKA